MDTTNSFLQNSYGPEITTAEYQPDDALEAAQHHDAPEAAAVREKDKDDGQSPGPGKIQYPTTYGPPTRRGLVKASHG